MVQFFGTVLRYHSHKTYQKSKVIWDIFGFLTHPTADECIWDLCSSVWWQSIWKFRGPVKHCMTLVCGCAFRTGALSTVRGSSVPYLLDVLVVSSGDQQVENCSFVGHKQAWKADVRKRQEAGREVMTCDDRWASQNLNCASQNLNDCETDRRLSEDYRGHRAHPGKCFSPSSYPWSKFW